MIHTVKIERLDADPVSLSNDEAGRGKGRVRSVGIVGEQHFEIRVVQDEKEFALVKVREAGDWSEPMRFNDFVRMAIRQLGCKDRIGG